MLELLLMLTLLLPLLLSQPMSLLMLLVVLDILVLVVLVQGLQLHHPNQQLLRQVLKLGLLGLLMLMPICFHLGWTALQYIIAFSW